MNKRLEFDSLDLSFDARKILSSIYMQCQQGEVVGLLGRNGSGKSSLMKVVFGTLDAEHKSVRINGVSLQGDYNRKRIIAYLPQDKLIPTYVTLRTAFRLFKVNINSIISIIPQVRDLINLKPNELSGGTLRLIEVLLILYSPSSFCILDEPFTGLMPIHIEILKSEIIKSKGSKGIIISDHMHRHVTELSDRLYLLSNGKTYEIKEKEQLVELGYLHSL
ncbi:MAG TPA: ATP-binding cassette domain-containing protein [Fulvivirga sp.]|nr:ATP-binding cassette domain-containing protein [Fulvivirga sp.]